ncbi:hypothetical protein HLH27_11635 [Gluconacetobacter takamatsuzukensis]|uniref:OmpA-like domain-containing protein n=2 Tax=Gluconacetobacter takamatsuzukensis TaxID=1286190 RepID=A0A7W4KF38_9PROT|nr:hypothetical protein [Gluconacetobacter takamatsuzukensis]
MKAPLPRDRAASACPAGRRGAGVGAALAGLLAGLLPLAGCAHRDAVDSTLDWFHQYQGGVIAQQRPPPPGAHDPYPAVGLTPTTPPVLPSAERRQDVTESLIEQRNLAHRMGAEVGPLTNTAPPATPVLARPAPAAAPGGGDAASSATLDAAEAPPPPPSKAGAKGASAQDAGAGPLVAMPEVEADVGGVGGKPQAVPVPPEIPAGPPVAPQFPGFAVATDDTVPTIRPDYALADLGGTRILFPVGNDRPVPGQEKAIDSVARHSPAGPLFVHGYGEAASTDSAEQARAMALALLRARAVADRLVADGVPAKAIHLRAHPFGDGVRVGMAE